VQFDDASEGGPVRQPVHTKPIALSLSAVHLDTFHAPVILLRDQDCLLKRMAIKARVSENSQSVCLSSERTYF
jgi:hypothetical protein